MKGAQAPRGGGRRPPPDDAHGDRDQLNPTMNKGFTHLDLWYQTRTAPHIDNTSAANNPNTDLTQVPSAATVSYEGGPSIEVSPERFSGRCQEPSEVSDYLIQRAMLDPDAKVVPTVL